MRQSFPVIGVGVVVLNDKGETLLICRGNEPNRGAWTIPGGRQEAGETVIDAAHREIIEETGVTIGQPKLVDVIDLIKYGTDGSLIRHYTLIDYAARYVGGEPRPGDDAQAVEWVSLDAIEERISWKETIRIIKTAASLLTKA